LAGQLPVDPPLERGERGAVAGGGRAPEPPDHRGSFELGQRDLDPAARLLSLQALGQTPPAVVRFRSLVGWHPSWGRCLDRSGACKGVTTKRDTAAAPGFTNAEGVDVEQHRDTMLHRPPRPRAA
jgi:hypothetical protein